MVGAAQGSRRPEQAVKRILITGASGMLGRDVQDVLGARPFTALSRAQLDILDLEAVGRATSGHDVVINCAAYTAVDDAETHEADAFAINAEGAHNLALAARDEGATLIHVSTDYVFNGQATAPYGENDERDPLGAYGRTKAAGEELILEAHPAGSVIVRSAWLFGQHGPNFVATMLRLAGERETLTVVDDQRGQPTWTRDLAHKLVEIVDADITSGIFHGTSSGETTWFGFAREIFSQAGLDPERVAPTDSASFVRPAPRPAYSVLGHEGWDTVGLTPIRDWRAALTEALESGVGR
jgi:dTDP-4-dehydrorhamnose reductase